MYRTAGAALLVFLGAATAVDAQIILGHSHGTQRGNWGFGVGAQMARPVGDFRGNVAQAWGGTLALRYEFPRQRLLGVRADLGFLNYGNERKRVPLSPTLNRVVVEQTTSNNIGLVTIGPELAVPTGWIRPYLFAGGGWSHFYTQSSASDQDGGHTIASSVNFSDGGGAVAWGGGVRIPVSTRRTEVFLDAGARFTRNWTRSYLRPGDVIDLPDGSLSFNERRTTANFWQYHLGASFTPRRRSR